MRLIVNLDPDAYDFTFVYAGAMGLTLSAALGELVRRAAQAPEPVSESSRLKISEYGYLEIVAMGHPITPEMVKKLSENEIASLLRG